MIETLRDKTRAQSASNVPHGSRRARRNNTWPLLQRQASEGIHVIGQQLDDDSSWLRTPLSSMTSSLVVEADKEATLIPVSISSTKKRVKLNTERGDDLFAERSRSESKQSSHQSSMGTSLISDTSMRTPYRIFRWASASSTISPVKKRKLQTPGSQISHCALTPGLETTSFDQTYSVSRWLDEDEERQPVQDVTLFSEPFQPYQGEADFVFVEKPPVETLELAFLGALHDASGSGRANSQRNRFTRLYGRWLERKSKGTSKLKRSMTIC